MTDLHTHILPGMDDGAKNVEMSLAMLRAERDQGIDAVALTPHFYREIETPSDFLKRREEAFNLLRRKLDELPAEERDKMPRLSLGAEVAWVPNMAKWDRLDRFCYEGTEFLLVEPPFSPWSGQFLRELCDLIGRGITPVIAHIDRYIDVQKKALLRELYELHLPTQISAEMFLRFSTRGKMLRCLNSGVAQLLISDCHNTSTRPPNLRAAMDVIRKSRMGEFADELFRKTDELLVR